MNFVEPRQKQPIPSQIVHDLMGVIRGQFCPDSSAREWGQQKGFFMRVILYPAVWLTKRGVTLSPERYKSVILDVFDAVKSHGQTDRVKYWPGYLLHCVQEHLKHHGDDLYQEGKSARSMAERAMAKVQVGNRSADPIESLAQAASVLGQNRRRKGSAAPIDQLSLL